MYFEKNHVAVHLDVPNQGPLFISRKIMAAILSINMIIPVSIVLIKRFLLLSFCKDIGFWSNFYQPNQNSKFVCFFTSNKVKLRRAVTCNPEFSFLPLKKQMRVTRICSVLLCDCAKMAFSG